MRQIWLALAIAMALTAAIAFAASLGVAPRVAASGSAPVTACGEVTDFELLQAGGDEGSIDAVRLVVDTSCNDGKAFVALLRDGDILAAGGPEAIVGGQATVSTAPDVEASQVTHLRVTMVGP